MSDSTTGRSLTSTSVAHQRRLPVGVELGADAAHVRVWAPNAQAVRIVVVAGDDRGVALRREDDGYFSGAINAAAGDRYQFILDNGDRRYPDPASRFQPEGPHGPSQIVDPSAFAWTDG